MADHCLPACHPGTAGSSLLGILRCHFFGEHAAMMLSNRIYSSVVRRLLNIAGIATVGAAIVPLAGGEQVFAKQFFQEATPAPVPEMGYSPELQLMLNPSTGAPVFTYSRTLLQGKANGEYQVAPLINCPGDPDCPAPKPPPTHTVDPGDGSPNGPGPKGDTDQGG
jgi:hypothetical protein